MRHLKVLSAGMVVRMVGGLTLHLGHLVSGPLPQGSA